MSDHLIQVGPDKLYDSTTIEGALGGHPLSEFDSITLAEIFPISRKWLIENGIQIDHRVDGRATASFVVWDSLGEYNFFERQQVLIHDSNLNLIFGGVVNSIQSEHIPGNTTKKFHSIEAADYTAILDWRLVDYAAENKLAGDAVREILAEYLAEEGIIEGYIEGGELLTEISIGNKSAFEGLKKLAEACNFVIWLDYDLKLYFHSRTLYAADWNIYDGSDILGESFSIKRSNNNYRNSETVIGGYEETALQVENFIGDGTTKTFPLAYPANRFSTVTVNGSNKTIGQKGTDAGSYQCYYAVNSETLTFDDDHIPAAGVAIEAQYYGLWRAKSKAEDLTAQVNNATRQGFGTGKIEHITIDESLTSIIGAGEYANAKLSEYAKDGIQVTYKTRRKGLAAGVLQHIEYMDLDHDFLITKASMDDSKGDVEYSIEAVHGPIQEEWELFLNRSFKAVYQIREGIEEGVGVTKLYNFSHTYELADRPNPFTLAAIGAGLAVSNDTWPCIDPTDKASYIEFWRDGAPVFRKQHTSIPDMAETDEYNSYTFISPSEAIGEIDEVVFFGGDSASIAYGSGVELYRAAFVRLKSILESYQVNMDYINGEA